MFLILYIILILIGLFSKKLKLRKFNIIVIIFLTILVYIKTNIPDWNNYNSVYNYIGSGHLYVDTGIGWYYLCKIFSAIGIKFQLFKAIIFFCSMLILDNVLNYYVNDESIKKKFWAFYLIFPALLDCIQCRFLIASSLFLLAFKYLSYRNKRKNMIAFLLFIISISIHSSLIFFGLFLFVKNKTPKRTIYNFIIILVFCTLFYVSLNKNIIIKIASFFINPNRIERYFYEAKAAGFLGFIIYSFLLIANYMIVKYIYNKNEDKKFLFVKNLNYLCLVIIPFLLFDVNFIRLARPIWILNVMIFLSSNTYVSNEINIFKIKFNYFYLTLFLSVIESIILFIGVSFGDFISMLI